MLRKCTEWMEILGFGLVSCEEGGGGGWSGAVHRADEE